ncbi:hypothetical protein [Metabacillus fastidiosus]|uniref:hypothetical protein n=1 Tax=Metabacillus fastidiosus TaxID=1458 RepID=UPI003D2C958A
MYQLGNLMKYVKQIDGFIKDLRRGMAHAHPHSVDALRAYLEELENARDIIMESDLESGENLDSLTEKLRECIRECIRPGYSGKPQVLPNPIPDPWKPPVTVTAVNIIFVCDISDSMFENGGLEIKNGKNGRIRQLLIDMAKKIESQAMSANVPTVVSLVGYADPTDKFGHNQPTFWTITLNKRPVSELDDAFTNINRKGWARGSDNPESGMTAMYKTIDTVYDNRIINGKPVENSIILVSDERNKMKNSQHLPHPKYRDEVSLAQVDGKFDQLKIQNRYALIPMQRGYTTNGTVGRVDWNRDVKKFFRQTKEYWGVSTAKDLNDWVKWTLDPTQAPKPK